MLYLWENPKYFHNKDIGEYDRTCSPDQFLLRKGIKLSAERFSRCECYLRSSLDLPDDPFIRNKLRPALQAAYILTFKEMFYCDGTLVRKIDINANNLKKLKAVLELTDDDIDKSPKALSDKQLQDIAVISGHSKFSPTPIVIFEISKTRVKQFDCLPNNIGIPLVNERVKKLLEEIAPDDVQFFKAKLKCSDGEMGGYYFVNATHKVKGIDFEKSIYKKVDMARNTFRYNFDYMTYKSGCMGEHKFARDADYLGNLLVREDAAKVLEKAKITGVRLVRPEDYYHPITAQDLIDAENAE